MISEARTSFLGAFDSLPAQFEIFAPGRVNLIGEHTDYNGGKVLPFAIGMGVSIRVRIAPRAGFLDFSKEQSGAFFVIGSDAFSDVFVVGENEIRDHLLRRGMLASNADDSELMTSEIRTSWARYVLGSLVVFWDGTKGKIQLPEDSVVAISINSKLPVGSGLSSSAALCTGLISSFCFAFGKHISAYEISKMAMSVEHGFSGTKCGLMDQLAVMCSKGGHFTSIDFVEFPSFQKANVKQIQAHHKFEQYSAVAFHTGVSHSLANSEYNQRRRACEKALDLLNAHRNGSCLSLGEYSERCLFKATFCIARDNAHQSDVAKVLNDIFVDRGVTTSESAILVRRAAHAIFENVRVEQAMAALAQGELEMLDAALQESHRSLSFDYEVSCSELDAACEIARTTAQNLARAISLRVPSILGPRMTGGGFGGSTVQLVHNSILDRFVETFKDGMNPYSRKTGCHPNLIVSQPQDGLRISIL